MNEPMDAQYENRWETFSGVFVRFYDLERKDIIRDNSNTCIKNKSLYNGLSYNWHKH
jgi:hypothetical protein